MRIHHLALRTADVERLVAFYQDVFGLRLAPDARDASSPSTWLAAGETRVMIEPRGPGEPGIAEGSMDLVAFGIEADERAKLEARLARMAVAIEARTDFTLYFRDPDGRRVAVSHYPTPMSS